MKKHPATMIHFNLNGQAIAFSGDTTMSLLNYLRLEQGITSAKDGCSGQGACGACLVEVNGKATLSCVTPLKKLDSADIVTIEGFPPPLRETLGRAFVAKGAVQCGFCTPGFLSRTKILLEANPRPSRQEIIDALRFNLCRCTGYTKIIEAIELAAESLETGIPCHLPESAGVGSRQPKYGAYDRALGRSPFVDDIRIPGMLFGALKFSDHPRAKVLSIDISSAKAHKGVVEVFTGTDIPGERITGILHEDWPVMVIPGETTRYIGDVLAGVVAESEAAAREALDLIRVAYEVLEPLTDMQTAEQSTIKVHEDGNLLHKFATRRGDDIDSVLQASAHVVTGTYRTQRIEHGYLETEAAVALPWENDGIRVKVQSQGIYEDREKIARLIGISSHRVQVDLIPCGGGFGGKEDLTVQGHAALFCYLLGRPVKVRLTRQESLRMHPKRHPMILDYALGCNAKGRLTALRARIIGDTGAYASVGGEVLARAGSHATGAYHIPNVDIVSKAVYTNNIPCGAMRGFGVNQATFAIESAVEALCRKGGFDPWQFRYDNALQEGSMTATGQILGKGVGLKQTLLAVKDDFRNARFAGIACGMKNCGIGNGIIDESDVMIEIKPESRIILWHGWTEMGQGVDTVALQILCEATGIDDADIIEVRTSTACGAKGGVTTASRATVLLGNAILDAARMLKRDLSRNTLGELAGKVYQGRFVCDWTNDHDTPGKALTHLSYGYATPVVVLADEGRVDRVIAAHDAGKIINPTLFEGQIEGAVMMGLGYALSENLPMEDGRLKTSRFGKLGIPRIKDTPRILVKGVEVKDPVGPFGAKGVGEIGLVPTAPAVANALYRFDKTPRYELPLRAAGNSSSKKRKGTS